MKILISLLITTFALADIIQIKLPLDLSLDSIQPLIITNGRTEKIKNFKVNKTTEHTILDINVDAESESLISIIGKRESGDFYSTPVRPSFSDIIIAPNLEICKQKGALFADSYANLSQLVSIRNDRLKNRKDNLYTILTADLLTKLQKRELSYGFKYEKPLSLELPEEELTLRLSKLEIVTKNIRER